MENDTEIMEIILLGGEPVKESIPEHVVGRVESNANLQVIELSDRKSKMALLRQLKLDSPLSDDIHDHANSQTSATKNLKENMETYALPPGTVLIKQDNKSNFTHGITNQRKPLRELAETTSSGSRTSGALTENAKRVQRPIRNRKTVEVRRNPTRTSKKNLEEDSVNPRQRLLSAKRKENFTNSEPVKRVKLSSTPYMNTRSVTRKLYTVGATYQAPTIHDAMEWKEWPVHGMHERPVFHPKVGLGVEYVNRFFKSLDGESYCEIKEESEVEVISVDPRHQIADLLDSKELNRRKTTKLDIHVNREFSDKDKTLEICMHTSLHSVLAYCAQVSKPENHFIIQGRPKDKQNISCFNKIRAEFQKGADSKTEIEFRNTVDKNTPNKTDSNKTKNFPPIMNIEETPHGEIGASSFKVSNSRFPNLVSRLEPKKCLITPRNSTNLSMNSQDSHSKLQDVIRGSSKNALIIIKPQELKKENLKFSIPTNEQMLKHTASDLNFELGKLDDPAISDETLMEMSSIYERFVPIEEVNTNPEDLHKSWKVERADPELKSCEKQNDVTDYDRNKNQTSEIAKILSEYIQSINKVPEARNCVLQCEVNNSKNVIDSNDQRKWQKQLEVGENRSMSKSRVLASNNKCIIEYKNIMQNKMEMQEVLDLSTVKSKEVKTNKENNKSIDVECLQNLLENTAILYCAATGVRQENLADYIDNLDAGQSVGWLEDHKS